MSRVTGSGAPSGVPGKQLRAARIAVTVIFSLHAAVYTNWVSRIPMIQQNLRLNDEQLGIALFGAAIGPLLGMPISGWVTARYGSRSAIGVISAIYCAALVPIAFAPSLAWLLVSLILLSATNGALFVAMSAHGTGVEAATGRAVFATFHAANNLGGLAGAGVGALAIASGADIRLHFAVAAAAGIVLIPLLWRRLLPTDGDRVERPPLFAVPTGLLALLGVITFCGLVIDSLVTSWSGVYLSRSLHAGTTLAAGGFVAYSFGLALGRLIGPRLITRLGARKLVWRGAAIAGIAFALALASEDALVVVGALGVLGLGLGPLVPATTIAAGSRPGRPRTSSIAAVSTMGYIGFFLSPSAFGPVAAALTLPTAFATAVLAAALGAAITTASAPRGLFVSVSRLPDAEE